MGISDERVEQEIIEVLNAAARPSNLDTILVELRKTHQDIDNRSVRNAVWRLIAKQKIELTSNQRLASKAVKPAHHG